MADTSSSSSSSSSATTNRNTDVNNEETSSTGIGAVIRYLTSKPSVSFLMIIRMAALLLTFLYMVPLTSFSPSNLYQKSLVSNAAISALRLHQRLPPFRISREYFSMLLLEDSAHYLFYSLIFISNQPITMVLLPITLFSFLHACSAILNVCNVAGPPKRFLENILQSQRQILFTIALAEITLMPTILFAIMAGLASIFTPFMYYQFVSLRYSSRRNPYSQQAFHWLRLSLQNFAMSPRCPSILRTIIYRGIELVCRFAPQIQQ
ncbi:transmembrane protein 33-containing Krueppel homolog 2 isoform X2 [Dermatophagoides farinae]|uniref:transmembrane protein 33-containing Krueppel homolog 2 isoform X2 n=1 Tax=Dermatophagoides farinae TaxID=6954 RepID=UPI003F64790F